MLRCTYTILGEYEHVVGKSFFCGAADFEAFLLRIDGVYNHIVPTSNDAVWFHMSTLGEEIKAMVGNDLPSKEHQTVKHHESINRRLFLDQLNVQERAARIKLNARKDVSLEYDSQPKRMRTAATTINEWAVPSLTANRLQISTKQKPIIERMKSFEMQQRVTNGNGSEPRRYPSAGNRRHSNQPNYR